MSELTNRLQQQLIASATRPLMQDANQHWYTGSELNLEKMFGKIIGKVKVSAIMTSS